MDESKVPEVETPEQADQVIQEDLSKQDEETLEKKENFFKKVWNFLWHSDSLLSYAVFIILAFIVLKFLIFPGVLFVTGYSDVAAVVSASMYHGGDQFEHSFDSWLEFHDYSSEEVAQWPFQDGLKIGDVIFVREAPAEEIYVGDIILFYAPQGQIIHRVIEVEEIGGEYFYTTKGDANVASLIVEQDIPYSEIKGKLVNKIPFLGYPKVALNFVIPWL